MADLSSPYSQSGNAQEAIKQERIYRYPGLHSFGVESIYQKLFFGRDQECQELFHLIRSNRLTVLYGKSGLGKTSLLQAGVFPLLRNIHLLPLRVRLNDPNLDPIVTLKNGIQSEVGREQDLDPSVDVYTKEPTHTWWEYFKTTIFWRGSHPLTPVLILDQFEEVFKLHNRASRKAIAEQLRCLVNGVVPSNVLQQLRKGMVNYNDQPPNIHIVLSLRIENVGELQELIPEIPSILSRRFILLPMERQQAEAAILKPAALANDAFITQPFEYQETSKNLILDYLTDDDVMTIEPYQLQLQCHHIERQVIERQGSVEPKEFTPPKKTIQVDQGILPDESALEAVVTNYYLDTIIALGQAFKNTPGHYRTARAVEDGARRLCEHGLLNPQGLRVSLNEDQIKSDYHLTRLDLDFLVERRLLRRERRLKVYHYELAHDSLAKPIMAQRRYRIPGKVKVVLLTVVIITLIIGISIFRYQRNLAIDAQAQAEAARKQTQVALEESENARKETAEALEQVEIARKEEEAARKKAENAQRKEILRAERAGEKVTELLKTEKQLRQELSVMAEKLHVFSDDYNQLKMRKNELESANAKLQNEIEQIREQAELNIDQATRLIEANNARTIKALNIQVADLETKLAKMNEELAHVLETKSVQNMGKITGINEPEMVAIKPGGFWMGSDKELGPNANWMEFPRHKVTIGYPFHMGKYEVTFEQYDNFALATGRQFPDDEGWGRGKRPVINVTWEDAQAYTVWLSEQTGTSYRLPTEAEWEYAARAGTTSIYWWGDKVGENNANCDGCGSKWDNKQTAPVGSFKPNPWGLYDTAGNVWEWGRDIYQKNYDGAPTNGSAWFGMGKNRVIRGGGWFNFARSCRSANRLRSDPSDRYDYLGFRVAAVPASQ